MERGIITSFYSKYRQDQKMSMRFETDLQRATNRQDWVNKLALKSDFLRRTFTVTCASWSHEIEFNLKDWVETDLKIKDVIKNCDNKMAEIDIEEIISIIEK